MEIKDEDLKSFMIKELEIIQGIINGIDNNLFIMKGWIVTLFVGTLIFGGKTFDLFHLLLAYTVIIVFSFFNVYFLKLRRFYIDLYNWVKDNRLKTTELLFDLRYYERPKEEIKIKELLKEELSIFDSLFYLSLAVLAGLNIAYMKYGFSLVLIILVFIGILFISLNRFRSLLYSLTSFILNLYKRKFIRYILLLTLLLLVLYTVCCFDLLYNKLIALYITFSDLLNKLNLLCSNHLCR